MSTEVSCLGFDVTDGFEKNPMNIASFDDLLVAARQQPEPQRLLFVFAGVELPNDPWGRPYQYLNPGIKGEIDVMSFGADGVSGGEGKDADVGSWQ